MGANKKVIKIGDKEFSLQQPGVRWYIKHSDECKDGKGNLSYEKYIDGLLEMVVIQDIKMDDFENVKNVRKLVDEIEKFLGAK